MTYPSYTNKINRGHHLQTTGSWQREKEEKEGKKSLYAIYRQVSPKTLTYVSSTICT